MTLGRWFNFSASGVLIDKIKGLVKQSLSPRTLENIVFLRRKIMSDDFQFFFSNSFLQHVKFLKLGYDAISEKAMAPHSSTLAWKLPWMEEPGRLQSMGS